MSKAAGKVRLILNREYLNGVCTALNFFAKEYENNSYEAFAQYMLNKIKKYGRKFHDGEEKVIVHLYNNEAEVLLKILAIYTTAAANIQKDYYDEIGTEYLYEDDFQPSETAQEKMGKMFT